MLSGLFGSCFNQQAITSVNADEFEKAVNGGRVQLVDVRSADEYAEGHIAYAQNIGVQQADFADRAKEQLDSSRSVYVYCRSGKRSMMAASILTDAGFKVVNLRGGIMEWEDAGKPVAP